MNMLPMPGTPLTKLHCLCRPAASHACDSAASWVPQCPQGPALPVRQCARYGLEHSCEPTLAGGCGFDPGARARAREGGGPFPQDSCPPQPGHTMGVIFRSWLCRLLRCTGVMQMVYQPVLAKARELRIPIIDLPRTFDPRKAELYKLQVAAPFPRPCDLCHRSKPALPFHSHVSRPATAALAQALR